MPTRLIVAYALIASCVLIAAVLLLRKIARSRRGGRSGFRIHFEEHD